jgi:glutathione peroxidase
MAAMTATRRHVLSRIAAAASVAAVGAPAYAQIQMSRPTAYAFSFTGLDGKPIRLAEHAGKPILIVNTASQCGYTPQYTGLQELWTRYRERGLLIVAVPSNDFGGQEPGGSAEIMKTAQQQYGVSFPLATKAEVPRSFGSPLLPMGRVAAAGRGAALEFSQVPGWPRRSHHCGVPLSRRSDGCQRHHGDRAGIPLAIICAVRRCVSDCRSVNFRSAGSDRRHQG